MCLSKQVSGLSEDDVATEALESSCETHRSDLLSLCRTNAVLWLIKESILNPKMVEKMVKNGGQNGQKRRFVAILTVLGHFPAVYDHFWPYLRLKKISKLYH